MSEYSIREAQVSDEDALVQFNWNLAKETEAKELDWSILQAGVRGILTEPQRGFYVVAEYDGQVVGATMITKEWSDWRNADFWWIQSVYVVKEHRRKGIFRSLFESLQQKSQAEQVCGFRLYVERDNHAAQQTYRDLGLHETDYKMFEFMR